MSADRKFCATIHIKPNNRHCFVELSNSIAKQFTSTISDKLPPIVGIESSSGAIAFASWRPHKSTQISPDDQVLFLGKGFADCLSLKRDDSVLVYFVTNAVPLEKVFIAPIKNQEWEILELNTQLIEATLLDQIRVAYSALEFPIFLKGSAIVNAKVESVYPNVKVGYLEEFTELHIAPELTKKSVISRDERKISRKFDGLFKKNLQTKTTTMCEKSDSTLSSLWNFIVKQGPEEIKEFNENTIHANTHSRPTASFCTGQEIINETKHISEVLRIHPVVPRKNDTQSRSLFTLNYHPFRCFVSLSTFKSIKRQCTCVFRQKTDKLIMKIKKIPSPRQKDEWRKIKARNADNSSVAENEKSAIIEIVPVNDDQFPEQLQMKNMAVSLEVMAFLNADQGSLTEIECLHKDASSMLGIIINVLSKKVPGLDTEKVTEIFRGWAERKIQSHQDQILLNDSTILEINKLEEPAVVVSLDFLTAKENESSEHSYFFLNGDSLTATSLVANFRTKEEAKKLANYQNRDRILENFKLFKEDQLGGFSDLIARGIAYLNSILKPQNIKEFSGFPYADKTAYRSTKQYGRFQALPTPGYIQTQGPVLSYINMADTASIRYNIGFTQKIEGKKQEKGNKPHS
ncbi:uncharacterized protein LOC135685603 [Rhopilema esculentum]|uniref:uncharacterized protein LOC135685603 n=1 Tax=Rhopilema esculentum TaxID=499914 RepID=UPI0031E171BF